ncbi:N-Acetylneuraminate cytidylyltransferase [Sandaracinus amylolyticus]|nr:N-Acetylneuraminate cytidylyltransferase [Sandaracinus amylolyticus]
MTAPVLVVRADAGPRIGVGHVLRSLALAHAWQERGGRAVFLTSSPPRLVERLTREHVEVIGARGTGDGDDLRETLRALRDIAPRAVVVDGYHMGSRYADELARAGHRTLVIDDDGSREAIASDVLNQNLHGDEALYPRANGAVLAGARFAMLRREFLSSSRPDRTHPERASRVLVTFGGADPSRLTTRAIELLRGISPDLEITALVGAANPDAASLSARSTTERGVDTLIDPPDVPVRLARADLAIAASGSTTWELAYLGTPMALVSTAPNQEPVLRSAARLGIAHALGSADDFGAADVREALVHLVGSRTARTELARRGQELIDGEGAARVAMHLDAAELRLRAVRAEDGPLLHAWANDPETRSGSFRSAPIPLDDHLRWFASKRQSIDAWLWIAVDREERDIGLVRFDRSEADVVDIGITIAPEHRGRRLAARVIEAGVARVAWRSGARRVRAFIRCDNPRSRAAFERAGFAHESDTIVADVPAWLLVRPLTSPT